MKTLTRSLLLSVTLCGIASVAQAEETFFSWLMTFERQKEFAPVTDEQYKKECGACHFAYPPGLLPEASWRKLLDASALQDHFGDNAELDEGVRKQIEALLVANSAEKSYYKRPRKIMSSLGDKEAPLRITEIPYIKEKHEEIPKGWVKDNPKVKSLSFCSRCHRKANDGNFDDDSVLIPGHEKESID